MTIVALDSNILLRLVHTESPEHAICQSGVRGLADLGAELVIAAQVAVEFWVVATRPSEVHGMAWRPSLARTKLDQILAGVRVLPEPPEAHNKPVDAVDTTFGT